MRVLNVNPASPSPSAVRGAARALEAGLLLAVPTETFYGVAADSSNGAALRRVNEIKGKPDRSPILLLAADAEQAKGLASRVPACFDDLAGRFWPGPLTLVLPARPDLPPEIGAGTGGVAVRVPGLCLPRELAEALGRPVSGVSANAHGRPACRTALEVAEAFSERLDWILDGGPTPGGAPSTILDIAGERPRLLREGLVPPSVLEAFLGSGLAVP